LHGAWIDCDGKDADDIQREVNQMLRTSPYPNVMRRQCIDCEYIQDDRGADDTCDECRGELSPAFPSAEEYAIHDHEGFSNLIGESTSFEDVALIAAALDGDNAMAFKWLISDIGMSAADAADKADEVCIWEDDRGQWDETMLAEYAEKFANDCYDLREIPETFRNYIDWEAMGRDMRAGGDITLAEIDGRRLIVTNPSEF